MAKPIRLYANNQIFSNNFLEGVILYQNFDTQKIVYQFKDDFVYGIGDLGWFWTTQASSARNFASNSPHSVLMTNLPADCWYAYTNMPIVQDQYVEVVMKNPQNTSNQHGFGPAICISTSQQTSYRATGSQAGWVLDNTLNGAHTGIFGETGANTFADGDTFGLGRSGNIIYVTKNGSNIYSTTDTTVMTGYGGFAYSGTEAAGAAISKFTCNVYTQVPMRFNSNGSVMILNIVEVAGTRSRLYANGTFATNSISEF